MLEWKGGKIVGPALLFHNVLNNDIVASFGKLMLIQRMLGITPHLTREGQARVAAMQEAMASKA